MHDFYDAISFSDDASSLVDTNKAAQRNIEMLVEQNLFHDAVMILSHALPKRESIWWASQCTSASIDHSASDPEREAIKVAAEWAMKPDEDTRLKAALLGNAIGSYRAAGMLAKATAWTSGSITPGEDIEVPPPPGLSCVGVAVTITLAALVDPAKSDENYRAAIKQGLEILAQCQDDRR